MVLGLVSSVPEPDSNIPTGIGSSCKSEPCEKRARGIERDLSEASANDPGGKSIEGEAQREGGEGRDWRGSRVEQKSAKPLECDRIDIGEEGSTMSPSPSTSTAAATATSKPKSKSKSKLTLPPTVGAAARPSSI